MATLVSAPGLADETLRWLLEPGDPSPRYLTLNRLLGRPDDAPEVRAARERIPEAGPARDILLAQYPQGYWMHPGIGYSPRYRATLWQILILAQLGMHRCDRLDRAVEHVFEANQRRDGAFRASREPHDTPLGLNGSLLWALEQLGYGDAPQVRAAWSWLGSQAASHGLSQIEARDDARLWSAVKVLWAANAVPSHRRDAVIEDVRRAAARLLLENPPNPGRSDPRWFQLTFPLTEAADLLQWAEVLVAAGHGDDPQLAVARPWLRDKRQPDGAWSLERSPGKLWADVGELDHRNKWITIRALAVGL